MIGDRWSERAQHLRDTLHPQPHPARLLRRRLRRTGEAMLAGAATWTSPGCRSSSCGSGPSARCCRTPATSTSPTRSACSPRSTPAPSTTWWCSAPARPGSGASVYAASEGLATLVLEPEAIGGQAGTSSLIRNYPGFPTGISGNRLAFSAYQQAWAFGSTFHFMRSAQGITSEDGAAPADAQRRHLGVGRTVVVATGATLAADRRARAGGAHRARGVLRGRGQRGAGDARPARVRRRRRQLRRAGRGPPLPLRRPGHRADPAGVARRDDVGLPDPRAGGAAERRRPAPGRRWWAAPAATSSRRSPCATSTPARRRSSRACCSC